MPRQHCAIIGRMKTMTSSAELEQGAQRAVSNGHRLVWGVYLLGAASLFALWFVLGAVMLSYLFGGWIMIGAIVLWLIEDTAED